jgi:hypothetical protein
MHHHRPRALRKACAIAVVAGLATAPAAQAAFGAHDGTLSATPTPNATVAPPPILPPPSHTHQPIAVADHQTDPGATGGAVLTAGEIGFAGVVMLGGVSALAARRRSLRRSAS